MAIQILGLRPKADGKLEDYSIFDKYKVEAPSVADILRNPDEILEGIPAKEHWNLFFTIAQCGFKKRDFESLEVLPFDFDGIDTSQPEAYIEVFCKTLGVKREETGIVFSGNGLHFYIGLQVPVVDKKFFTQNRHHYKALLEAITQAVKARELPIGKVDPAVFDAARILRMPNTKNIKEGRAETFCRVIQPNIVPILFDITLASGLPNIKTDEAISKDFLRKYPETDNKAILGGCNFLKFCKDQPNDVTEPQWYAMLSITARMKDGNKLSHELSKGHKSYSYEATEAKIEHAVNASPPRKCSSINGMWGQCRGCPHFEKVESPIMLASKEKLKTESTGFHQIVWKADGTMGKPIPCYSDLRTFFERKNFYVSHSKLCFVYNGKHYEPYAPAWLENFAQMHFNPYAHTGMTAEFKNLVLRTNVREPKEWADSTKHKINFQNGYLDVPSLQLLPHDRDIGFRYVLPYAYDPDAKAPRFEKFMEEITLGDNDLAQVLLEFGGYALSGDDCKGAKALFLTGEGRNGKSTFIKVLKALAGPSNYQTISLKDFSNMERRHALDGALFNIAEETPNRVADSNDFKNLVDGGELKVRKLFSDDYTIENRAKLLFTCNELPESYDNTVGFKRRLLFVPFNAAFEGANEDKDLDTKLYAELAGIFNLMLAAYRRFVARGKKFTTASKSESTLDAYMTDNDPIRSWINDRVELIPITDFEFNTTELGMAEIYGHFAQYCDETRRHCMSLPWFGRRLKPILPDYKERFNHKENGRFLKGIILKGGGGTSF